MSATLVYNEGALQGAERDVIEATGAYLDARDAGRRNDDGTLTRLRLVYRAYLAQREAFRKWASEPIAAGGGA